VSADQPFDIEVSVVIPVYHGAKTVAAVVERTNAALADVPHELVLVDDGSKDDSWTTIEALAEQYEAVRGLRLLKNYGQHAAVVAGFEAAVGRWVVTIDDDGENDPAAIPSMLDTARAGRHDLVFAARRGRKAPLGRRLASSIVNGVVTRVFHAPDDLVISNYRLMTNAVAKRIVSDGTQYPYVNGLALEYSGRPTSVPIEHGQREQSGSRYTLRKMFRLMADILFSYSIWAYRIVVGIALLALALLAAVAAVVIVVALFSDDTVPGWASSVVLLCVISAVNLVALTVIGEYVVRSLKQSRAPAIYIVEERT
jgi:glycosyltransferase involved in cell wall biosynthesis